MAKRPEWNVGAKSKLSLRSKPQQQSMPLEAAAASNGQAVDGLAGKGAAVGHHVLIKARPVCSWSRLVTMWVLAGCKPTRKACANCSCGRADAEARGEKVLLNGEDNAQSACGSVCFILHLGCMSWSAHIGLQKSTGRSEVPNLGLHCVLLPALGFGSA